MQTNPESNAMTIVIAERERGHSWDGENAAVPSKDPARVTSARCMTS
jgi:hypothetical protein